MPLLQGRTIRVNEAQPSGARSGGGGGYRGGGRGGGGELSMRGPARALWILLYEKVYPCLFPSIS